MRDAPNGSTICLEALADEIQSQSKRRDSENFRPSHYSGLAVIKHRLKYRDCEFVRQGRNVVRKLSAIEREEFRAAVQRAIEAAL